MCFIVVLWGRVKNRLRLLQLPATAKTEAGAHRLGMKLP